MSCSFDLFQTLVAGRNPDVPAGNQPESDLFPIAENVAKVQPGDVVISDYFDEAKARRVLREVCGLSNELIVSPDGKAKGDIWRLVKTEHHLGDDRLTDYESPRARGIEAEITDYWKPTPTEIEFGALGLVMREARLRTWNPDPTLRGLQLHQIERNFPFLLKAAHLLNTKMSSEGWTRMLLCSRDCYLLCELMQELFPDRDIRYFYNSRLMRYRPTKDYAAYARNLICERTLIVDMCGTGNSLKWFCDNFSGTPFLVVGYSAKSVPALAQGSLKETSNPAPHPSVNSWPLVFVQPNEKIQTMVDAFLVCAEIAGRDSLPEPQQSIESLLSRMSDKRTDCLWNDHVRDSDQTYQLLVSGPLPHRVVR